MTEERRLTEWLAEYRDSLDPLSTPPAVEARLRAELRQKRHIRVAPWLLAAGAAALLLLGIGIGRWRGSEQPALVSGPLATQAPGNETSAGVPNESSAPLVTGTPTEAVPETALVVEPVPSGRSLPRNLTRRFTPPAKTGQAPQTMFVLLPGTEGMPPAQELQVLRVRIPRARMQALGWPITSDRLEERVLADVVVGEDGVARAVRLVPAEQ